MTKAAANDMTARPQILPLVQPIPSRPAARRLRIDPAEAFTVRFPVAPLPIKTEVFPPYVMRTWTPENARACRLCSGCNAFVKPGSAVAVCFVATDPDARRD